LNNFLFRSHYFLVDPDGDRVQFSTDEELLEALGFISDSVFKVYVRENGMLDLDA